MQRDNRRLEAVCYGRRGSVVGASGLELGAPVMTPVHPAVLGRPPHLSKLLPSSARSREEQKTCVPRGIHTASGFVCDHAGVLIISH